MGARQRAQKRGKAAKDSQKGSPASQRKLNSSMHVPDLNPSTRSSALLGWQDSSLSSSLSGRKFITMGDTARNTERHMFGLGSSNLRNQGITFVSAGTLHQEPEYIKAKNDNNEENDQSDEVSEVQETVIAVANTVQPTNPEIEIVPPTYSSSAQPELTETTNFSRPRIRSPSLSSSETEQIVFRGRSKDFTPKPASLAVSKKNSRTSSSVRKDFSKNIAPVAVTPEIAAPRLVPITKEVHRTPEAEASSSDRRITNTRLRTRGRFRRRQSEIDEQEAIMRDYIANMAMDDTEESDAQVQTSAQQQPQLSKGRKNETFRFYDGSGEDNMKVQVQSTDKIKPKKDLDQAMDWNSDDLQDFDDLSTSDEEVKEISQVLRHRARKSGSQYLVTPIGRGASEAKWILHEKLISESAQKEIAIFEEIMAMEFEEEGFEENDYDEEYDDETTDEEAEEALNDLIDHIESEDDENARIMKHVAKMTDEQIARALAKQEELGLGGDELILLNGDIGDEDDNKDMGSDNPFGRNDDFIAFSVEQHTSNRNRSRRNKKNRDTFPSAAAFADALDEDPYGGFDVMDFDRPSLRPKKKGRKSDFPYDLELEDEDLKEQLYTTWMKDRDKKVQRKREKEEARQAILLEYADRSDPAAIKSEIRQFLMQETDTLRLAPMESATRASVHRLAKALKLNSRSEGKEGTARGRYPVLTKTMRTPSYTIDTVWEIDALLNTRKFFPKNAHSYKKDKLPRGTARTGNIRRSGGVQGASYMNGEIVGASAPELGADNKGRAMLEKMGWTSGMAIGAEGNKGSLEAIKHVFKVSRAGLG